MSNVRARADSPIVEDFRDSRNTPVVVRTGASDLLKVFALRDDQVICDLFTGVEQDIGVWEDLRFPSQAINPMGAVAGPSVDTTLTGYPGTLLFSGVLDNIITGVAQMPHGWRAGSLIRPHIHWTKTTADGAGSAVDWQFVYRLGNVGEQAGALSSPIAGTLATGDLTTLELQNITHFGNIDMTGHSYSSMIFWQVKRLGSSDAYGSDARLIEFDIHYQIVQAGTESPNPDH